MAFKKGVIPWNKGQTAAPITEETRAKMRAAHTGHPSGMKGKTPWNKGLTKETDARVATISYENHPGMSGKTHSPEARAKISAALSGRRLSEETKKKLSAVRKGTVPWNKGMPMSEEARSNVSNSKMGSAPWNRGLTGVVRHTDEARAKMSESRKGHPPWLKGRKASNETKAKLREVRKSQWSNPDYRAKMLAILASNAKTEDTEIERLLNGVMAGASLRPEKQYFVEGSKIDFAFPSLKIAIYVDGCYWHKCPTCNLSIGEKHALRINETPAVDKRITETLEANGWLVLRFWGHEVLDKNILNESVLPTILKSISRRSGSGAEKCDKNKLSISPMPNSEANQIVIKNHYLHRPVYIGQNISYAVAYQGIVGTGVIMFGYPLFHVKAGLIGQDTPIVKECCRQNLNDAGRVQRLACVKCQKRFKSGGHLTESGFICAGCIHGWNKNTEPLENGELVDMIRVWLPSNFPSNSESCAISKCIKLLETDWPKLTGKSARAIISFADEEFGHSGAIYKASNFIQLGSVKGRKAIPYEEHGRWNGAQQIGIKKNVYLYIIDKSAPININSLKMSYE